MAERKKRPNEKGGKPVPVAHTFSPAKKAAFLLALLKTGSIRGASSEIGVHYSTVYRAAEADATFRDDIERTRGEWEQRLVDGIVEAGFRGKVIERKSRAGTEQIQEPGDWRALAWALEHAPVTRERYAGILRQKVQIGGDPDGVPVEVDQNQTVSIEIGPGTMERLQQVFNLLVQTGKLRLPDPNEIIDVTPRDD